MMVVGGCQSGVGWVVEKKLVSSTWAIRGEVLHVRWVPHPRRHAFVGGQVVEYGFGWCGDVDEVPKLSHPSPPAAR